MHTFDYITECKTPAIAEQEFLRIFRSIANRDYDLGIRLSDMREFFGFTRGLFIGRGWQMSQATCRTISDIIVSVT